MAVRASRFSVLKFKVALLRFIQLKSTENPSENSPDKTIMFKVNK